MPQFSTQISGNVLETAMHRSSSSKGEFSSFFVRFVSVASWSTKFCMDETLSLPVRLSFRASFTYQIFFILLAQKQPVSAIADTPAQELADRYGHKGPTSATAITSAAGPW